LGLSKLSPYFWSVDLLCVLLGKSHVSFEVVKLVEHNLNSLNMLVKLLVDAKGLLIESVLLLLTDLGKLVSVVVIKSVDVVHNFLLLGLNSGKNEQVLEVFIVGKARIVEDNLFEQFNELFWKFSCHESFDGV